MSALYYDTFQAMLDHFYSKQEALKISEATNTPYDKISDKQHKKFIDSLANKLIFSREKYDQIFKQLEEELQQLREKQQKNSIIT